jgi:hypothetical protein
VGIEFLQRVRRTSVVSGLICFAAITTYLGFPAGAGFVVGCGWSLLNLFFIGLLVKALLKKQSRMRLIVVAFVKIPVLYGFGFLLMRTGYFPLTLMVAGFTWPFIIITLKALGRFILKLDNRRKTVTYMTPEQAQQSTHYVRTQANSK